MKKERSAGFILFREDGASRLYLILQCHDGGYEPPKGIIEVNESEKDAALRELREETGLEAAEIDARFRKVIGYRYRNGTDLVSKKVVYFLARSGGDAVRLSDEHKAFAWLPFDGAIEALAYVNVQNVLRAAEAKIGRGRFHGQG